MEIAILISILVLCMLGICLVCVTELMKKMCDRMNWLQDQFNSFKDYNDKEYAETMKQVNDLRSRLKSLEDKVKEDEDDNCDNFYTVHSQIYAMGCRVKKNEEDTYNAIKDNEEHFNKQVNDLKDEYSNLMHALEKHYNKHISSIHDAVSQLRDQLKLIEDRVEKYKDGTCDNLCTVHSQINALNSRVKKNEEDKVKADEYCLYDEVYGVRARLDALDCKVKRNEEDTYKIIKDNEKYFGDQVNSLRAINKKLTFAVEENKEMINEIRTEMSNKEEKKENE